MRHSYLILALLPAALSFVEFASRVNLYRESHRELAYRRREEPSRSHTALYKILDRNYVSSTDRELVLDDFKQIIESIVIFQDVFGDCNIPNKFEVPAEQPWPSMLHGLRLGKRLEKLMGSREFTEHHKDKVSELRRAGWDGAAGLVDDWATLFEGLQTYREIHGDLRIPSKFIVPEEDPWPRLARGLKLGVRVAAIRSAGRYVKDHPERKIQLDEIGFEWRYVPTSRTYKLSLAHFTQGDHLCLPSTYPDLVVSTNYVVPSEAPWPAELWGLKLGLFTQAIRSEKKLVFGHPERIAALTELGFQWDDSSRTIDSSKRFELIFQAMLVYKQLKGDLFVPQSFVVPQEGPWPEDTWGIKLGSRVSAIRSQSTFVSN
ncbi:hypothetical protein B484DRAFT_340660, partial [Ochromonadaceae sp. CCMP2298]